MATGLEQTAVNPHNLQPGQARRSVGGLAQTALNPLRRAYEAYQRSIGQPFQQAVRGGVRGYFGLPLMSDANPTGREAYRQGEALGYTPGVGMPAGAVRVAAEGMQALPSVAGEIGRVISAMPSGAGAAQAEDFARYQRSIPPSDVSAMVEKKLPTKISESGATLKDVTAQWDAAGIRNAAFEKNGVITLSQIIVPPSQRERGVGTSAMQSLVDYADTTGQRIALSPSADFGGNKKRLMEFYKKFGFVENKGRNKDFAISETMIREPQLAAPAKSPR
jgi:GNAT superfamily N-acetyltransferase